MEVERVLRLIANQHEMIDRVEDPLDQLIDEILSQTECLTDEDLEDVQAAVKPFAEERERK